MAPKKGLVGKDAFARMNYLYQASKLCSSFSSKRSQDLAAYYGSVLSNVAKKAVVRVGPEIKRQYCKGCNTFLIPGENTRTRLKKKPSPRLVRVCLRCFTLKRFGVREDYKIWAESVEAVLETKTFSNKATNAEQGTSVENVKKDSKPVQCSSEQQN